MADKILRAPAVQAKTGLCRTSIWNLERRGEFPERVLITGRAVGWRESAVENWIATRAAKSGTAEAR